eukprot:scaffold49720_cov73-Phaeocystis_antarctica.AAC.3
MRTQRTGCNCRAAFCLRVQHVPEVVLSCRNFHIMHCEHTTAVNERPGTPHCNSRPYTSSWSPCTTALAPAPAIPAPAGPCTSWPLQWSRGFPNDFPPVDSLYHESVHSLPAHYSPRKSGCTRDQTGREHSAVCTLGTAHPILQPTDCTPYSAALFCSPSSWVNRSAQFPKSHIRTLSAETVRASPHAVQQRPPPSTSSTAGGGVGDGGARRGQCSRAITRAVDQRRGIPRG